VRRQRLRASLEELRTQVVRTKTVSGAKVGNEKRRVRSVMMGAAQGENPPSSSKVKKKRTRKTQLHVFYLPLNMPGNSPPNEGVYRAGKGTTQSIKVARN